MTVTYYGPGTVSKELFTRQLVESPPQFIAIDVETISLKEKFPIGFSIATSPEEAWYFKIYPELDPEIELLRPLLASPNIKKVYQNAMFDVRVLPIGLPDFEFDDTNVADTLVMARLLGRVNVKLGELSPEVGMYLQNAHDLMIEYQAKTMLEVPTEAVSAMCASHAKATLALFFKYLPEIDTDYFNVEMAAIPILIDMSQRGLKIDQESRAREEARLEADVKYYRALCAEEDFNPGSPQQVSYILAKRGNFLPMNKKKTAYRTDEKVLQFCPDPLAAVVLNYREANTLLTRYVRPLAGLERVYTEYSLDTVVGRTTSSKGGEADKSNMQNWPPEMRYMFMPDGGTFTHGDFSQEHLRILMHMSGDRKMQEIYYEGRDGGDIHQATSDALHIPRQLAKIVNFAIPYGGTAKVIHERAKIGNMRVCQSFLDNWFDTYIDAAEWLRGAQDYGLKHGKSLPTLFGREVTIPEEWTVWGKLDLEAMKRKAVNYPILGSDGEIMKRALIICSSHGLPLAVQVHDSIDCLHPDTRILTDDLKWKRIADIRVGELIIGLDEYGEEDDKYRRRLKKARVLNKLSKVDEAYSIAFDNGTVVVAGPEHRWLQVGKTFLSKEVPHSHGYKYRKYSVWTRTLDLSPGDKVKFLASPWDSPNTWEAGYIAGLLDGEGGMARRNINFTQNEGIVLDMFVAILEQWGIPVPDYYRHNKKKDARTVSINSMEHYLYLSSLEIQRIWEGKVPKATATVRSVTKLSERIELFDLQTSSHTFVAEGLFTHNCDGDIEFPVEELEAIAPVHIPFSVEKNARWK